MASAPEKPDLSVFKEESDFDRLSRKSRDSPLMVIGLAGCVAACAVGAYRYKNRGSMSTSNFLMQLRVTAQGMVIGALTLGVGYSLYKRFTDKKVVE